MDFSGRDTSLQTHCEVAFGRCGTLNKNCSLALTNPEKV